MAGTEFEEAVGVFGPGLGAVIVEGVATASVGLEREVGADAVAEVDGVFIARAAAVAVVFAGGKEGAEDAMLHVEEGHVLVKGDFEPGGWGGAEEGLELMDIEIVARGDAFEVVVSEVVFGGEGVGGVKGEVAPQALVVEKAEVFVMTGEVAVGLGGEDLFENPFFAWFEKAGGG